MSKIVWSWLLSFFFFFFFFDKSYNQKRQIQYERKKHDINWFEQMIEHQNLIGQSHLIRRLADSLRTVRKWATKWISGRCSDFETNTQRKAENPASDRTNDWVDKASSFANNRKAKDESDVRGGRLRRPFVFITSMNVRRRRRRQPDIERLPATVQPKLCR